MLKPYAYTRGRAERISFQAQPQHVLGDTEPEIVKSGFTRKESDAAVDSSAVNVCRRIGSVGSCLHKATVESNHVGATAKGPVL